MSKQRITKPQPKSPPKPWSRAGRKLSAPRPAPVLDALEPEGRFVSETYLAMQAATAEEAASVLRVEQALGELRQAIFGSDRYLPPNEL